jgi:hypothetical protein
MRFRVVKVGTLLCVLGSVAWGAVAMAATTQTFKGKTSQRKGIRFKVSARTIKSLRFSIDLQCSDGNPLTDSESGFQAIHAGSGGKFADDQTGGPDDVKISGRIKGKKATGKITVTDKLSSTVKCGPRTVKFTVRRP